MSTVSLERPERDGGDSHAHASRVACTVLEMLNQALIGLVAETDDVDGPLLALLHQLEASTSAKPSALFVAPPTPDGPAVVIATAPEAADAMRAAIPIGSDAPRGPVADFRAYRLSSSERTCGWLVVGFPRNSSPDDSSAAMLTLLASRLGDVVDSAMRASQRRRHHLHEERATIARELHDSLAQSLSYLKIQVARLRARSMKSMPPDAASDTASLEILDELRSSLNVAYRQLRELITTFRLTMNGRSLSQALEDSVEEFQRRSGIVFELDDRLEGGELDADEEIQVVQIAREALSNIVRHAHARHARLTLRQDAKRSIILNIVDDGIGIGGATDADNHRETHHGLVIMQERAQTLGGTLLVGPSRGGGTTIQVAFEPRRIQQRQAR